MNERFLNEPLREEIEWHEAFGTWVVNKDIINKIDGLSYYPNYISSEKENEFISIIDSNPFSTSIQRRQQFYGKVYYHTLMDCKELQPPQSQSSPPYYPLSPSASVDIKKHEKGQSNEPDVSSIHDDDSEAPHSQHRQQSSLKSSPITSALSIDPFGPLIQCCIKSGFFLDDDDNFNLKDKNDNDQISHSVQNGKQNSDNLFLYPDQVLVNEYVLNYGIRSHFEDTQAFGPVIVTISLNDPIWITLKRPLHHLNCCPTILSFIRVLLQPRSCLVMAREARYDWRHGITKAKIIRIRGNGEADVTSTCKDNGNGGENSGSNNDYCNHDYDKNSAKNIGSDVFIRDESYRRLSLTIRKLLDTRKQVTNVGSNSISVNSNTEIENDKVNDSDNGWKEYANRWNHEVCSCDNYSIGDDNNLKVDFKKKTRAPNTKSSKVKTNKLKSSKVVNAIVS